MGLTEQAYISEALKPLAEAISPQMLGSLTRQRSYIRFAAKQLLSSHAESMDEQKMDLIIEALAGKMHYHGHTINRKEAENLGLKVEQAEGDLDREMWELYKKYEVLLKLKEPMDVQSELAKSLDDRFTEKDVLIACIESEKETHAFSYDLEARAKRQVPSNIQIPINLNLQLPPNISPPEIPERANEVLQRLMQLLGPMVQKQVEEYINKTAPIVGAEARQIGPGWREITEKET